MCAYDLILHYYKLFYVYKAKTRLIYIVFIF